jgi:hypothetical protein
VRTRSRGREQGASLVELALVLPLLALLAFGTVDLARAYRLDVRLTAAAREGAAFAQTEPNDIQCPGAANDVRDRVALEDPGLATSLGYGVRTFYGPAAGPFNEYGDGLCLSQGGSRVVSAGQRVRVEVRSTFTVLTPLVQTLVGNSIQMSSIAEVEVQG